MTQETKKSGSKVGFWDLVIAVAIFLIVLAFVAPDKFEATIKVFSDIATTLNVLSPQANSVVNNNIEFDTTHIAAAIVKAAEIEANVSKEQFALEQRKFECDQRLADIPWLGRQILDFFGKNPCSSQ